MQLLAPMMMFGALAVSIPLALHFFYRARYKPLPWGPMKFLKEAIEQTSRRVKFQEWVLLALRCLAILLLALAISRPGSDAATTSARGGAIDAVFVFDTSYSMAASDGEKTRLQRAKEAALAVLDTLPAKSSVKILGCSGVSVKEASYLGPTDPLNIDQARAVIGSIEVTSLASDLLPGLKTALEAATAGLSPAKEIYVFTDLQKSAFEAQEGAIKAKCAEIKAIGNLVFVRCGRSDSRPRSVAVMDVSWKTDIPHTKSRVPFVITLKNTGKEAAKGIKVNLTLDGKAVEKDAVQVDEIEPGNQFPVTLTASLDTAGVRVVGVRIDNDGIPGDNVLFKTILVRETVKILLVDGNPRPDYPTEAGDHFVKTSFAGPLKEYIETESVPASEAGKKDLNGKDIVYLLNAPVREADPLQGLSAEFIADLAKFVKDGGGLVISCGELVNAAAYNKVLGSGGAGLLPFDLKEVRYAVDQTSRFHPAADKVEESSFLAPFRKSPYADSLEKVSMLRMFEVVEPGPGTVLVRTPENRPYVASRVVGSGEVVLVTGALDESWGNFSSDPGSFHIPFALATVTHLTGRKIVGGTVIAGESLSWTPLEGPRPAGLRLGLSLRDAPEAGGVIVDSVVKDDANTDGVAVPLPQDVITEIDGKAVKNTEDYFAATAELKTNTNIGGVALRQGAKVTLKLRTRTPYELVRPAQPGETLRPRDELDVIESKDGKLRTATANATSLAGVFNIVLRGKADDSGVVFTVNPDLRETADLELATDENLTSRLGFKPAIINAGAGTEGAVNELRTQSEWTEWVLLAVLLLLLLEATWAWSCGRAW